ncbi:MAG: DMT family transporter, partial [Pseudomonadota bacterium]
VLRSRGGKLLGLSKANTALVALVLTVTIWASFLVVTRAAVTGQLGALEVGLIRFGTGALLFLPILWRHGFVPKGARLLDVLMIAGFGGVAFILLLAIGLRFAPVADSGVFTPSMLPFYVAVLSFFLLGERFTKLRLAGFALILMGALTVGGWEAWVTGTPGVWRGHLLFTAASLSWAAYTVVFRRSGLTALQGGAVMCGWSALALGLLALIYGLDFSGVSPAVLLTQVFFQGVLSGFVATFTYFYAVSYYGASQTAALAALVPVLAALGGWVFLGEEIGAVKGLGILVVSLGVALASGALAARQRLS